MKKRLISVLLLMCILINTFVYSCFAVSSEEAAEPTLNKDLLDAMLIDRHWVIDTLVHGDLSTNPYARLYGIDDEKTMMDTALSQYGNEDDPNFKPAYKLMVDALNVWYHKGDYASDIAGVVVDWAADILEFFGGPESVATKLRSSASTSKTMQYDNILQEVLKGKYTSSTGQSLDENDSQLVALRSIKDGVGKIKTFTDAFKKFTSLDNPDAEANIDYYNSVLIPTSNSYEKVMKAVGDMTSGELDDREQALLDFTKFLGRATVYNSVRIRNEKANYIMPTYFLDDTTKSLIKYNADAVKFTDLTFDSLLYVSSIQTQKGSVAGVLERTADHVTDTKTSGLFNRYADLINNAADERTLMYDAILTSIRKSGYIEKFTESKVSDAMKKLANRILPCYETSIVPGVFASITGVVGTATYLADAVTGLEDTCTKTLELKNLDNIISMFVDTYIADMNAYTKSPTEENAIKVIDDLNFLMRLRLRGETIAYKMSKGQLDTWLGKLLAGTSEDMVDGYYDYDYQRHIDMLLGSSVVPFATDTFTVKNSESVSIYYDTACGGLYASYMKNDGNLYYIPDLAYRSANGITVESGGRLIVMEGVPHGAISHITNNGGDVYMIGNVRLGEYTQNSGTTYYGGYTYGVSALYLNGGELITEKGASILCDTLNVSGTAVSQPYIRCTEEMSISGKLDALVYLDGNMSANGGTLNKLIVSGNAVQSFNGTLYVTDLSYKNVGTVRQNGTIYVSATVENLSSRVVNGQNTVLKSTGWILGDRYNSGITLDGATLTSPFTFGGTLITRNTVSLAGISVKGNLIQSGTLTLNGDAVVSSLSDFSGTVTHNGGTYYAGGDITVKDTNSFASIVTNGKQNQTITGTLNTGSFTNTNPKGVTVSNNVNVSGTLQNEYGAVSGMGMTLLSGGKLAGEVYNGDLTLNATCDLPKSFSGNLVISADNTITEDTSVGGSLTVNGGSLNITKDTSVGGSLTVNGGSLTLNKQLSVNGRFNLSRPLTANEGASIICGSSFVNSGTVTAVDVPVSVRGFLNNSGTLNGCHLTLFHEFINSGTVTGGSVTTSGDISNNGTMDVGTLNLTPAVTVTLSGKTLNTSILNLSGKGKLDLTTSIRVSDSYNNSGVPVNENNITVTSGRSFTEDCFFNVLNISSDVTIDGADFTVNNLTVSGSITLLNGADFTADTLTVSGSITLLNGATLHVKRLLTANGSSKTFTVSPDSSVIAEKVSKLSSYTLIDIDGAFTFGGDAYFSSTKLTGDGEIVFNGDLIGSSLTVDKPGLVTLSGKAPQTVTASGANFNDLVISNPSRRGVTFPSTVYCYGDYTVNGSVVSGTVTQK